MTGYPKWTYVESSVEFDGETLTARQMVHDGFWNDTEAYAELKRQLARNLGDAIATRLAGRGEITTRSVTTDRPWRV